ncbi:MAG: VF530 family DNA-binding protein [Shewanella sp.]
MNQANNPLHGLTLEAILTDIQSHYGWEGLYQKIRINCFNDNPSIKSSHKFLRNTTWAREKVEILYLNKHKLALPPHLVAVYTQSPKEPSAKTQGAKAHSARSHSPKSHSSQPTNVRQSDASASDDSANVNAHIWGKN